MLPSTIRRITKNTTALFLAQTAYFISGLIVMTFSARILGVSNFGNFTFAVSLVAFMEITSNLGINLLLVRDVAKDRENVSRYWGNLFLVKIILATISFIFIVIISFLFHFEPKPIIYILALSQFFNSIVIFNYAFFQAVERMEYQFYITLVEKILISIFVIVTLFQGFGLVGLALVFLFGRFISMLFSTVLFSMKITRLNFQFDFYFIRQIVRRSLSFALFIVMGTIYFQIDTVLLSYFVGNQEVGYYQAAIRLIMVVLLLPDVITKSLLPVMSYYYKNSKKELNRIYEASYKYLIILALPISMGLYFFAKPIILFVFGNEYGLSITVLKIVSWIVVLRFFGYLPGVYLTVIDQQKLRTYIVTGAAIFSIGLNIILIPKFGLIGASVTNLLSNILVALFYIMIIQIKFHHVRITDMFLKPISAILLTSVFLILFGNSFNAFITAGFSIVLYITLLFLFKSIKKEELIMIIGNLRK